MIIVIALVIGWWFRGPIEHTVGHYLGRKSALPAVDTTVGAPSP